MEKFIDVQNLCIPSQSVQSTKHQGQSAKFVLSLRGVSKLTYISEPSDGVVAQLVEHHNGIVGVRGSNPLGSTILLLVLIPLNCCLFSGQSAPLKKTLIVFTASVNYPAVVCS